jgi:hypothetical protein
LTPDHDVLTSKGWKPIAEITKKDEVYVLKADGSFGYENPVDLIVKDCKEEILYDLHSQQVDLCVTQDHAMWVKCEGTSNFERVLAKELIGKSATYMKSCVNPNKEDCVDEDIEKISLHEPLPEWIWKLGKQNVKRLFECSYKKQTTLRVHTKQLADDLQRLALHAELSADYVYDSNDNTYYVTLNEDNSPTLEPKAAHLVSYTGKVYCFEVPSHVFYCRRNGKPVWIGNCSSHGQKGVFGMILPQHDMPYTKDGIVPDLIINPHAFPSRMTIGHLVETVTAKLCCLEGCYGDGTVFLPFDTEKVYSQLEDNGYERHGNEILYNGRTGQQIETEIFMGPIFYYRLKHMVSDKVHARGDGPRTQLTYQPTSGRSKKGGLRVGEMERDVLLAHGLAQFTKEHMMEKSDKYRWAVCRHCGVIAKYNPKSFMECMSCEGNDVSIIETPYAFKLLVQEMEAMGVQIRLGHTAPAWSDEDDEDDDTDEPTDHEEQMIGGNDDEEEPAAQAPPDPQSEDDEGEADGEEEGVPEPAAEAPSDPQSEDDVVVEDYDEQSTDMDSETDGAIEPVDNLDTADLMSPMEEPSEPVENETPQNESQDQTGGTDTAEEATNNVKVIYIGESSGAREEPRTMKGAGNMVEDEITNVMGDEDNDIDMSNPMDREFWDL